jgi:hypothetical protein
MPPSDSVETNKVVGALFPNDGDGNAWGDAKLGFPPVLHQAGYTLVDTGRFQPLTDDYGSQIFQLVLMASDRDRGTLKRFTQSFLCSRTSATRLRWRSPADNNRWLLSAGH